MGEKLSFEGEHCIDVTAVQEFDVKTKKDSSNEECDRVPSDQGLKHDEKVSLLSDEEDEETTGGDVTVDKAVEDEAMQVFKPDKSTEDNLWMKLLMTKTLSLVVRRKNARDMTFNLTPVPEMDQSVSIPQFLQLNERRKVRWAMCLSKMCSEA